MLHSGAIFNVKNYGAVGDGKTYDTAALSAAIDDCHKSGGGTVLLQGGAFLCAPFRLKSDVRLFIDKGAVLLASPRFEDYFDWNPKSADGFMPRNSSACFIFADGENDIAISGEGKIDCNGQAFVREKKDFQFGWRYERIIDNVVPRVVFFTGCKNIDVSDVTLENAPSGWAYWINGSENVRFSNCKIYTSLDYPNNDGVHLNCVSGAVIENCDMRCGDDCVAVRANSSVFKDETKNLPCENVVVRNCRFISYSAAIRLGWINDGVIKNCTFENIQMENSTVGVAIALPDKLRTERSSDEGREYSFVQNITFKKITMDKIYARPIIIRVGLPDATLCRGIENINFSEIHATAIDFPYIAGKPACKIGRINFNDCTFIKLDKSEFTSPKKHGAVIWSNFTEHDGFYLDCADCSFSNVQITEK